MLQTSIHMNFQSLSVRWVEMDKSVVAVCQHDVGELAHYLQHKHASINQHQYDSKVLWINWLCSSQNFNAVFHAS